MTEQSRNDLAIDILRSRVDQRKLALAEALEKLNSVYVDSDRDGELETELDLIVGHMMNRNTIEGYAIAVTGPSGAGKSTMVNRVLDHMDEFRPRDDGYGNEAEFCLRVQVPASCRAKDLGVAILRASGYDLANIPEETQVWNTVYNRLQRKMHKLIFLDEFQHALKGPKAKGMGHLTDTVKVAMADRNWPVWFIFAGVPAMMELVERDEWFQTERRVIQMSLDDVENTDDAIENVCDIIMGLADAVELKMGFPLMDELVRRIMHGGLWRFGMIIQLIKMSIEMALKDDNNNGELAFDHFVKGYKRLSNCDKVSNVMVIKDWHLIVRQVTRKGKLTRHYDTAEAA